MCVWPFLVSALTCFNSGKRSGNDGLAAATCAYLALRLPELKQVRTETRNGQTHIDQVFDKAFVPAQTVQFTRPDGAKDLH